jgi:glucose-6-phosphate 1-dehydrogenase
MTRKITSDQVSPTTLVIFGITGDLAQRKLLPALYYLAQNQLLPDHLKVVGVTRKGVTVDHLISSIRRSVKQSGGQPDEAVLTSLAGLFEIAKLDLLASEDYVMLRERLDAIEDEAGVCMNRQFYLAIPAQAYEPVIEMLGKNGLNKTCQHGSGNAHLLIEKPFGYDLPSARELIDKIHRYYTEDQVYRIDHYLAKETAQNILTFRFKNPIFKRIWDHKSVTRIIITAAERIDIEGRAAFYEQTGALRDFVQSHLLQLLALTTMDEPSQLNEAEIHAQKLALLEAITPIAPNQVATKAVRGQYEGYRSEVDNPDSATETYAALGLDIANTRWQGVPVLIRTGKALKRQLTDITLFFSDTSAMTHDNILTIRIQPDEGIGLQLLAKKPGFDSQLTPVQMDFSYNRSFADANGHPDAYERVLVDAFRSDKTLFATSDEVLASWRIIESVTHEWGKNGHGIHTYKRGAWGPAAADALVQSAGGMWPDYDELPARRKQ